MNRAGFILTLLLYLFLAPQAMAQDNGRYAGDPLLQGAGARSLGMGSAFVAISNDATAVYWNPAGLARLNRHELLVQHAEQFGGTVNHDVFAAAGPSSAGGFGGGLVRLGVDDIKLTGLEDPDAPLGPDNRPVVSSVVGTTDYTFYLGYGRQVRPDLALGTGFKIIRRNLSVGNGSGYGIDLGALYTPSPQWSVGLVIRNLTRTRIHFDSGTSDRISPSLLAGLAYHRDLPSLQGRITASTSLHLGEEKSNEDNLQGIQLGAEYVYRERIALRLGAEGNHFTAGAGVRLYQRVAIDLAFLENGQLDNTYRISASVYF
ncbi:MAG: PorV/PorQ family protein [bacterium]|nr:PorV/PorQ family protein [bacterium]